MKTDNIYKEILECECIIKEIYYENNVSSLPDKIGVANFINFNYVHDEEVELNIQIEIVCFDGSNEDLGKKINEIDDDDKSKICEILKEEAFAVIREVCAINPAISVEDISEEDRAEINKLVWLKIYPQIKTDIDYLAKKAGLPNTGLSKDLNR